MTSSPFFEPSQPPDHVVHAGDGHLTPRVGSKPIGRARCAMHDGTPGKTHRTVCHVQLSLFGDGYTAHASGPHGAATVDVITAGPWMRDRGLDWWVRIEVVDATGRSAVRYGWRDRWARLTAAGAERRARRWALRWACEGWVQ